MTCTILNIISLSAIPPNMILLKRRLKATGGPSMNGNRGYRSYAPNLKGTAIQVTIQDLALPLCDVPDPRFRTEVRKQPD
jgi:hypothetical protein